MEEIFRGIAKQVREAVYYLAQEGGLNAGDLVVVGCSTSEVLGGEIGKESSPEVGQALSEALMETCGELGLVLAVQCCEHLNRALVLPREYLEQARYTEVSAVPFPKAGGSLASAYYRKLTDPALAETIQARAGLDIGGTLIGMHLRRVAVPLRGPVTHIGRAHLNMAVTRPPLIGGVRAKYALEA